MASPQRALVVMPDAMLGIAALGPYAVLDRIGEGGMGAVYRARDTRLDRLVALKVILSANAADACHRRRLLDEARAASALSHPNIVTVYDAGSAEGEPRDRRPPLHPAFEAGSQGASDFG